MELEHFGPRLIENLASEAVNNRSDPRRGVAWHVVSCAAENQLMAGLFPYFRGEEFISERAAGFLEGVLTVASEIGRIEL